MPTFPWNKPDPHKRAFGRLYRPDPRDANFRLLDILPPPSAKTQQYWWADGEWLDQDGKPECVAYAWAHWWADGPITHKTEIDPDALYLAAQKIDGEPAPHDGTTVRAAAKVMQDAGEILNYYWAQTTAEITRALLDVGPVTVGTEWFDGMMKPCWRNGYVSLSGNIAGGHAYVLDGVDTVKGIYRIKNSWGKKWGKGGFAFIKIKDFARLLADYGEACLATEATTP